ncbi:MAG: HrgC protein [Alphaproteobacteria bacterium]|nr:HrgC protein [Alphaproteobacteria bacterium]MBN2779564.1 HrgC protein [Alphaproteobacteria bacterium]
MRINLKKGNHLEQAKVGFSWTVFFFGPLVPLFRGDLKWFVLTLVLGFLTLGLVFFYFIFAYNMIYIKGLLKQGYKPADKFSTDVLRNKGVIS